MTVVKIVPMPGPNGSSSYSGIINVPVNIIPEWNIVEYTLNTTSIGKLIICDDSAYNNLVTIPVEASSNIPAGSKFYFSNPDSTIYFWYEAPTTVYGYSPLNNANGSQSYWSFAPSAGGTLVYLGNNIWQVESNGLFND